MPQKIKFINFVKENDFVFLGLHGGDGENGKMQKILKEHDVKYNGSGEMASRLCMDKFITGELIRSLNIKGISTPSQKIVTMSEIRNLPDLNNFWLSLKKELDAKTVIAKPRSDGCSTGVAHLYSLDDFKKYFIFTETGAKFIPINTLHNQENKIEMPSEKINEILFEKFIETDIISVSGHNLKHIRKSGFIEITMGLLEKRGKMFAFNPSITISEGEVLSLEEKFQGGTGINITPPPEQVIKSKALKRAKMLVEKLAHKIGLSGYARIDTFMNVSNGDISIIEVNTLPGLTPSTVLYHQALSENPQIFPLELLEIIIKNAGY